MLKTHPKLRLKYLVVLMKQNTVYFTSAFDNRTSGAVRTCQYKVDMFAFTCTEWRENVLNYIV